MKYLCIAYGNQKAMEALRPEQMGALMTSCQAHDAELRASGQVVAIESLSWSAMTIRPRGGKPTVTDGPFVESKEQIGGYMIIEARDLNEALRVASMHPAARCGEDIGWAIEVRPIEEACHG